MNQPRPCGPVAENIPPASSVHDDAPASDVDEMEMETFEPPTNYEPHPSLEYPPLYFGLEQFPRSLEKVRRFYQWRRAVAHPFGKRIPGSRCFRHFGWYITYGDVFFVLPLVYLAVWCAIHTFVFPDVVATGKVSRGAVIAALLLGQKNSYITMLFGLPFDRAVELHKIAGYIAVATGICHGIAYFLNYPKDTWLSKSVEDQMNASGTAILAFLVLLFVTSLPAIRQKLFEVFYYIHLICLIGVIGGTAFHTGLMVPLLVFGTTGLDFLVRKVYMERMRYPRKARIQVVSETVVEVSLQKVKGFDYNPGQYVYLTVPAISKFQAHPFSFASSPQESQIVFYIRRGGNWTNALYKLARESPNSLIDLRIDGPYGNISMDLIDKSNRSRYPLVVLISGGIGLTPLQSVCTHLLLQHSMGLRELKKVKMIWVERDPQLMTDMPFDDEQIQSSPHVHRTSEDESSRDIGNNERVSKPEASQQDQPPDENSLKNDLCRLVSTVPPGTNTECKLDEMNGAYNSIQNDATEDRDENQSDFGSITDVELGNSINSIDEWLEAYQTRKKCSIFEPPQNSCSSEGSSEGKECCDVSSLTRRKLFEENDSTYAESPQGSISSPSGSRDKTSFGEGGNAGIASDCAEEESLCVTDSVQADGEESSPKSPSVSSSPRNATNLEMPVSPSTHGENDAEVLDMEIYLTHKHATDTTFQNTSGIHYGRPNVAASLASMKEQAVQLGISRVAVLVCGPKRIAHVCRKTCIELSDSQVRFDYHEERFG